MDNNNMEQHTLIDYIMLDEKIEQMTTLLDSEEAKLKSLQQSFSAEIGDLEFIKFQKAARTVNHLKGRVTEMNDELEIHFNTITDFFKKNPKVKVIKLNMGGAYELRSVDNGDGISVVRPSK